VTDGTGVRERESVARRASILDAAARVFLRYGLKKTSMDDLARAAGLSRQGLYLHFKTKEALFKEAVLRLVGAARADGRAALTDQAGSVEERLVGGFVGVHGHAVGEPGAEHMTELLGAATTLVGPALEELEQGFITDVARVLRASGVAARWKSAGISARDLAEHLYATSCGVKHRVATSAEYRERMRVAVHLACAPRPSASDRDLPA
jgi:AcrR family transcriptional regulator